MFAPHNEHRILVSRLIFLGDLYLTGNTGWFSLIWVFVFHLGHLLLVLWLFRLAFPSAGHIRHIVVGILGLAIFFSGSQYENFISGFQNQFTGVFFFATAAFAQLAIAARKTGSARNWLLCGAWSCGLLSTASMANGLLIWLILPPLAFVIGLGWRWTLVFALSGLFLWPLYLWGLSLNGGGLSRLLNEPLQVVMAVFAYLGGPLPNSISVLGAFSVQLRILAVVIAGGGVLAVLLLRGWQLLRPLYRSKPEVLALLAACTFIVLSAVATALGRAESGVGQVLVSRYSAGPAALWIVTFGLCLLPARWPWSGVLGGILASMGVLVIAIVQPVAVQTAYVTKVLRAEGQAALLSRAFVASTLTGIYHPGPERPLEVAEILRARKQSLFVDPYTRLVGQTIALPEQQCALRGQSRSSLISREKQQVWRILFIGSILQAAAVAVVTDNGQVEALLLRGQREDRASNPFSRAVVGVWAGFLPGDGSRSFYRAVAVDKQARPICIFENRVAITLSTP